MTNSLHKHNKIRSVWAIILIMALLVVPMDGLTISNAEEIETDNIFTYTGCTTLYAGEKIQIKAENGSASNLTWECSDYGTYTDVSTSGSNSTGNTFTMKVTGGTDTGAEVIVTAHNTDDNLYQQITFTLMSNDQFWFTQGTAGNKVTESSIDLPIRGSIHIGTNINQAISFSNISGYASATGSADDGYDVTNGTTDSTTAPSDPIVATSSYTFMDTDGYNHTITISVNIHVIDILDIDMTEVEVYKGLEDKDSVFSLTATPSNLTTTVEWSIYKGNITAGYALAHSELLADSKSGISLKNSTSASNKLSYSGLNDEATITITSDLDLTDYSEYTILAHQLIYGERSINAVCHVTILQPVNGLVLSTHEAKLSIGGDGEVSNTHKIITATLKSDSGLEVTDNTVLWESTDESVATVVANGSSATVTGKKPGECYVVATSKQNPDATDILHVSVKPAITSVDIVNEDMTVNLADEYVQLFANVHSNAVDERVEEDDYDEFLAALNKNVIWSTNDETVASVDMYTGKVILHKAGQVTITCKSEEDSKIEDSVIITVNVPVASVELPTSYIELNVGDSYSLWANLISNYTGVEPSNKEVTWESSDSKVAVVDNDGKVTGRSGGTATIICFADSGNVTATCTVYVYQAVTRIDLSESSMYLNVGEKAVLEATVYPTTASKQEVTWTSNKPAIASVNSDGEVTANKVGDPVVITATIVEEDQTITATCTVYVIVPITSITMTPSSMSVEKGDTFTVSTTVTPSDASNKNVVYGSTNTAVCTVTSSGKVKAVGGGSCYITARSAGNKDMMTSTYVTVSEEVSKIKLGTYNKVMRKGDMYSLKATVYNVSASNRSISFSSSNTGIAKVNSKGVITAVNYGSCIITVKAMDGSGVYAKCKVTVRRYVTSLSAPKTLYVKLNTKTSLVTKITPSNADVKTLSYLSYNKKVVSVSKKGVLNPKKIGSAFIIVTTTDGSNKKARVKVIVKRKLTNQMIAANRVAFQ